MKTSTFVPPSAASDYATLFVALELSKSKWLVGLYWAGSDKMSEHTIVAGEYGELLGLIDKRRQEVQATLLRPVRVVSCYEAGYDGFWLHRALCANGVENLVLDPASIPVPAAETSAQDGPAGPQDAAARPDGAVAGRRPRLSGGPRAYGRTGGRTPPLTRARAARQGAPPTHEPDRRSPDDAGNS